MAYHDVKDRLASEEMSLLQQSGTQYEILLHLPRDVISECVCFRKVKDATSNYLKSTATDYASHLRNLFRESSLNGCIITTILLVIAPLTSLVRVHVSSQRLRQRKLAPTEATNKTTGVLWLPQAASGSVTRDPRVHWQCHATGSGPQVH